jgi:hypothetical protein
MLNPVRLSLIAKIPKEALDFFKKQGAKGGKMSAAGRMEKMTGRGTFQNRQEGRCSSVGEDASGEEERLLDAFKDQRC